MKRGSRKRPTAIVAAGGIELTCEGDPLELTINAAGWGTFPADASVSLWFRDHSGARVLQRYAINQANAKHTAAPGDEDNDVEAWLEVRSQSGELLLRTPAVRYQNP